LHRKLVGPIITTVYSLLTSKGRAFSSDNVTMRWCVYDLVFSHLLLHSAFRSWKTYVMQQHIYQVRLQLVVSMSLCF